MCAIGSLAVVDQSQLVLKQDALSHGTVCLASFLMLKPSSKVAQQQLERKKGLP